MKTIDNIVREVKDTAHYMSSNIANYADATPRTNPSGEDQIGADIWSDSLFYDALSPLQGVGEYASEEREEVGDCGEGFAIAIDPLDGSSNLASNNSVGTIVGVYDENLPAPGRDLVASMMVLYGPYTTMTVARDDTDIVQQYLLRDGHSERWGQFSLPDEATVVGLAGIPSDRNDTFNEFANNLESEMKLRYGGATVADLAQVLEYGGLFGYPKTDQYPNGKLRVHFEAAPLAYLVEAAGGGSTDGNQSILDVEPDGIHGRTSALLGNQKLIDRAESVLGE